MYDFFPTGIHWVRLTHNLTTKKYVVIESELYDMSPTLANTTFALLDNTTFERFEKMDEAVNYLKNYPLRNDAIVLHKDYEDREELFYLVQKDFDLFRDYLKTARHTEKDNNQIRAEIYTQFGTDIKCWEG